MNSIADVLARRGVFTFKSGNGSRLTLPEYTRLGTEIEVDTQDGYKIFIKPIFPFKRPSQEAGRDLDVIPRFAVVIRSGKKRIHSWRHCIEEISVDEGVTKARSWIRARRWEDRLLYLLDPRLCLPAILIIALDWFLFPIVGFSIWLTAAILPAIGILIAPTRTPSKEICARIGRFTWDINNFCRGWMITGDTGSGKTEGMKIIMHSLFKHQPDWGGMCCDEKGLFWETIVPMASHDFRMPKAHNPVNSMVLFSKASAGKSVRPASIHECFHRSLLLY